MITLPAMSMVKFEYHGHPVEAEVLRRNGDELHVFASPDSAGWVALNISSGSEHQHPDRNAAIAGVIRPFRPAEESIPDMPTDAEIQADMLDGIEDETVMPAAEAIKILTQRITVLEERLRIAVSGHEDLTRDLAAAKRKLASYRRLHDSRN